MPRPIPLSLPARVLILATLAPATIAQTPPAEPQPLRAQTLLGEDSWLRISGSIRGRYEGISGQYRNTSRLSKSDQIGFLRTMLRADAKLDPIGLTAEILDARGFGDSSKSSVNASAINGVDVLQAYAETRFGEHRLRAGRETMDLGSRRLVARNRFRNTLNAFTGVDWMWNGEGQSLRAFWTMPVIRLPTDIGSVVDEEVELDKQSLDFQMYGVFHETHITKELGLETYFLVVDQEKVSLRRRELYTPGFRIRREPAKRAVDYEIEAAYQFGDSRTGASASSDLDHRAWFTHASVGYTFDAAWSPRLRLAFDYASGDRDPGDGENNRFDTLFGARRFEYGPTGIYGAVLRSNLLSPELRLITKPAKGVDWMVAWRGVYLAQRRDAWVPAGVQDPAGQSGRNVGQQVETRLRWDLVPKSLRLDVGGAYLFAGSFQERAPGGDPDDTAYGYAQLIWTF